MTGLKSNGYRGAKECLLILTKHLPKPEGNKWKIIKSEKEEKSWQKFIN